MPIIDPQTWLIGPCRRPEFGMTDHTPSAPALHGAAGTPPPSNRLHALDAVRAIALLLGVFLHTGMSLVSGYPIWIVQDSQADAVFGLTFFVPHIFRMTLFFLIAGYFARLALNAKGFLGFTMDRTKRIALPFIVLWLPIFSAIVAIVIWGAIKANGGTPPEGETPPLTAETFPLTHMWFLYVLAIFYAVCIPLAGLMRLVDRADISGRVIDAIVRLFARTPLGLIVLAAPMTVWFMQAPEWWAWLGIPTPDRGLIPNSGALLAYGLAFATGWVVHRSSDLVLEAWKRSWWINLAAALGLTVWLVTQLGLIPSFIPVAPGLDRLPVAAGYMLAVWTWTFGLTGLALIVFKRKSAFWRYQADASYWVYLMHIPVVMALQVLVSDWPVPGILKLVGILAVTMAVLLGSYHLLVRRTWVGGWLNGRRHGKTVTAAVADATPSAATH
jgi:peptidoglycan/LPS O-acetylase OafA/YrhL